MRTTREIEAHSSLEAAIQKNLGLLKRQNTFRKKRQSEVSKKFEEFNERFEKQRSQLSQVQSKRHEDMIKLNRKYRDIDRRKNSRGMSLSYQQELSRQSNLSRQMENQEKQLQQKAVLDCIKERIWRKHKKVQARRQRQQQIMAPPSTYDIYMQSAGAATSSMLSASVAPAFQGADASAFKQITTQSSIIGGRRQTTSNHNLNWRNPLADFGKDMACETSIMNGFGTNVPNTAPGGKRVRPKQRF